MATKKNDAPDTEQGPVVMTEADIAPVVSTVQPEEIPLRWVRVSHHTPDHIAARYPYAAYGSNLSLEQMSRRCPMADIVTHGTLRGAKLVFAYYMGIIEAEGASVPMGVFKVTAADVAALDRHEGLGRSYERYLVTVDINGTATRCFTYVKRDNALEAPYERYYQTCLRGYADWDFDARRLRHARTDAQKNGKRRTYSSTYGYWSGEQTRFDWDSYRKGTAASTTTTSGMPATSSTTNVTTDASGTRWYQDGNGAWRKVKDGSTVGPNTPGSVWDENLKCWRVTGRRGANDSTTRHWNGRKWDRKIVTPAVPSYDEYLGYDTHEPEGTGAGHQPKTSLVTGRELPSSKAARKSIRQAVDNFKKKHGHGATIDPDQKEFTNGKGERWVKGKNNVWYRAKGE